MMHKRISIIPGFTHDVHDDCYAWLIDYFSKQGFRVQKISIDWKRKVMTDYVSEFKDQYHGGRNTINYILGFSFGAMIALIAAQELAPDKLILCSLSPYFKEDLSGMTPADIRVIGKRRITDFQKYSANTIAKTIATPTTIFCGGKEARMYPDLLRRCKSAANNIPRAKLIIAKDAPHQIDFPTYQAAIRQEF